MFLYKNMHALYLLCRINLVLRYDNLFLEKFGSKAAAKTKVKSIINLARPIFQWSSLGSKIGLNILEIMHVDDNFQLGQAGESTGTTL